MLQFHGHTSEVNVVFCSVDTRGFKAHWLAQLRKAVVVTSFEPAASDFELDLYYCRLVIGSDETE